jgi:orotate phosphoribosyltransferase
MNLLPTQEEVMSLLERTGSLRHGYYQYPNGTYANTYLQIAHSMRYYQHMKTMSVALSRKLRANTELRAMIPQLSIVSPATGGLAVAYGIVEALRANMVYWAEEVIEGQPQRFRQYVEPQPGEKILLVDDILRTGRNLTNLKRIVEERGAIVVGIAVMVYQPTPRTADFGEIPLYHLARIDAEYYTDEQAAAMKAKGIQFEDVWV